MRRPAFAMKGLARGNQKQAGKTLPFWTLNRYEIEVACAFRRYKRSSRKVGDSEEELGYILAVPLHLFKDFDWDTSWIDILEKKVSIIGLVIGSKGDSDRPDVIPQFYKPIPM